MAPKAKVKAAAKGAARMRRPAGGLLRGGAAGDPGAGRRRRGVLRRPAGEALRDAMATWREGEEICLRELDPRELVPSSKVVITEASYYGHKVKLFGTVNKVEVDGGAMYLYMKALGTTSEDLLRIHSGDPSQCLCRDRDRRQGCPWSEGEALLGDFGGRGLDGQLGVCPRREDGGRGRPVGGVEKERRKGGSCRDRSSGATREGKEEVAVVVQQRKEEERQEEKEEEKEGERGRKRGSEWSTSGVGFGQGRQGLVCRDRHGREGESAKSSHEEGSQDYEGKEVSRIQHREQQLKQRGLPVEQGLNGRRLVHRIQPGKEGGRESSGSPLLRESKEHAAEPVGGAGRRHNAELFSTHCAPVFQARTAEEGIGANVSRNVKSQCSPRQPSEGKTCSGSRHYLPEVEVLRSISPRGPLDHCSKDGGGSSRDACHRTKTRVAVCATGELPGLPNTISGQPRAKSEGQRERERQRKRRSAEGPERRQRRRRPRSLEGKGRKRERREGELNEELAARGGVHEYKHGSPCPCGSC